MELTERGAEDLRSFLTQPGWAVLVAILRGRMELIQHMLMWNESERGEKGPSDLMLRAEYRSLLLLVEKPLELIQAYDRIVEDSYTGPHLDRWVKEAVDSGMRVAGFPKPPDNLAEETQ